MPVIKSAKKKLRKDKKREKANNILRKNYIKMLKDAKKTKNAEKIRKAVRLIDKATNKKLMHKNKAARIKSSLAKLLISPSAKTKSVKKPVTKKSPQKPKK